jgi:hypothetical protein
MTIGSLVTVFPGVCSDGFPENSVWDHQDASQRPDTAIPHVIHDCAVLATPLQPHATYNDDVGSRGMAVLFLWSLRTGNSFRDGHEGQ